MFRNTANSVSRAFYRKSAGLFVLRLVTGVIFFNHGLVKLQQMPVIISFFGDLGLPHAFYFAWFITGLELVGGAALILGVATRLFGGLLAIEMIVAILLTGVAGGLAKHGMELLLAAASSCIGLVGSGSWSLYKMECNSCGGMFCREHPAGSA